MDSTTDQHPGEKIPQEELERIERASSEASNGAGHLSMSRSALAQYFYQKGAFAEYLRHAPTSESLEEFMEWLRKAIDHAKQPTEYKEDDPVLKCRNRYQQWVGARLLAELIEGTWGRMPAPDPSGVVEKEDVPGQYGSIWDAWDGWEAANKVMNGGPVPDDPPYQPENIRKNYAVIKMAAAERGAKWMRDALQKKLAGHAKEVSDLHSALSAAEQRLADKEMESIEFAEWIIKEEWEQDGTGWRQFDSNGEPMPIKCTAAELFQLFKQHHPSPINNK